MARIRAVSKLPAVVHRQPVLRLAISNKSAHRRTVKSIAVKSAPVGPKQRPAVVVKKTGVKLTRSLSRSRVGNAEAQQTPPKRHYTPRMPQANMRIQQTRPHVRKRKQYLDQSPSKSQRIKSKVDAKYSQYNAKIQALEDVGKGRVLVILACGPSIKEAPLELIIGHESVDFMAINQPYGYYPDRCPEEHRAIWPARFWAFCDHSQYKRNSDAWNKYIGVILNSAAVKARHPGQIIIKHRGGKGFSKDISKGYHIGRSSTFANMQVAWYMNYDRIYIFGLDMGEVDGKLHHYGKNPDVSDENRKARFTTEAEHYSYIARSLTPKEREKFVMCSSYNKWPFMESFQNLHQKEAPAAILRYINGGKDTKD